MASVGKAEDYVRKARDLDSVGIRELWQEIKRGATPGWPLGKAMEHLVLRAFELDGAKVRWPFEVRFGEELIEQIDGVIRLGAISVLVETKDQQRPSWTSPRFSASSRS